MKALPWVFVFAVAACGGAVTESRPPPPPRIEAGTVTTVVVEPERGGQELVLIYIETGGCAMMGPNCATYQLWSDGTIEVFRSSFDGIGDTPEDTDEIDAAIPAKIQRLARELAPGFLGSLPEGSCQGCVDGIDVTLVIHAGPAEPFHIDSVNYAVPWDDALFATVAVAREQMGELLTLDVVSR